MQDDIDNIDDPADQPTGADAAHDQGGGQEQQDQSAGTQGKPAAEGNAEDAAGESQAQRDERGRFKGGAVQSRIDEITRSRHEAEREAAYWRGVAQRGGQPQNQGGAPDTPAAQAAAKPSPDGFKDYAEYVEALADWKAGQKVEAALRQREEAQQVREQEAQQAERARTWAERQQAYRVAAPGYDSDVMAADVAVARHVADVILDSEHGPALAHHLARNPQVLQRINALQPLAAARELGRIEAGLPATTTTTTTAGPAARSVSKAPAPANHLNTGRTATRTDLATAGMDDYVRARKAQGARWAS